MIASLSFCSLSPKMAKPTSWLALLKTFCCREMRMQSRASLSREE